MYSIIRILLQLHKYVNLQLLYLQSLWTQFCTFDFFRFLLHFFIICTVDYLNRSVRSNLQLLIKTLQLSCRGGRRIVMVRRKRRLQTVALQHLKLVAQLLHPRHSDQQLPLLVLEQTGHLLDLLHCHTNTGTQQQTWKKRVLLIPESNDTWFSSSIPKQHPVHVLLWNLYRQRDQRTHVHLKQACLSVKNYLNLNT